MRIIKIILLTVVSVMALSVQAQVLAPGVTKELADHRKANISNVLYDLTFNIPSSPEERVTGTNIISFDMTVPEDVVLDFQGGFKGTCYVYYGKKLNKKREIVTTYSNEHIIIPGAVMAAGPNKVEIEFTSLDKALNRHQDYMYTLFVPDRARSVFPCFDQPDLRGRFLTHINAPLGWKTMTSDGCCPLPTYLYSFVAGNFDERVELRDGRAIRALFRENNPDKIAQLSDIFSEVAYSIKWMQGYTGIACPFGSKEFGLVILPGYQFAGMEHPGAIQLSDRRIFLEKNPTEEEMVARTELIAHETAHLWFGDLVSPKWFEDVWTKEVFANFMASKITRRFNKKVDHDLNFIKTYQTNAIAIDRTEGTHPIAQKLANLNHASLLYDNIIYDKAPVMMRIMEDAMEAPKMQNGLVKYLSEYAYGNASWDELIDILDKEAPDANIRQFNDVWVNQKGMPFIHTSWKDSVLTIKQTDPYGRGIYWRQMFQVKLIYDMRESRTEVVYMNQPTVTIKVNRKPNFIIPNIDGRGYGRFTLDPEYTQKLPLRLITMHNDLNRYSLLQVIHDNYLMGNISPSYFSELYRMMLKEKNPLIMSTAIDHMFKIAFDMQPEQRKTLELCILDLTRENPQKECRQLIIRKLAANATSPEVLAEIQKIWEKQSDPLFNEYDYMEMAYRLAIMNPARWKEILNTERSRLKNSDMRQEFDYVCRACDPNGDNRIRLFNEILKPENRQHEPWTLHTLRLLNADVFEPQSNAFIEPSLKSLPYLQQTSDIFFPASWVKTLFATHRSDQARNLVSKFLKEDTTTPENLRNKILEATWVLTSQQPYKGDYKPIAIDVAKISPSKKITGKKKNAAAKKRK